MHPAKVTMWLQIPGPPLKFAISATTLSRPSVLCDLTSDKCATACSFDAMVLGGTSVVRHLVMPAGLESTRAIRDGSIRQCGTAMPNV